MPLNTDRNHIEYQKDGFSLGLKNSHTGYINHIKDSRNKANTALDGMYRLKSPRIKLFSKNIKSTNLTVLSRSITHTISDTQIGTLQKVKKKSITVCNKSTKFIYNDNREDLQIF